MPVEAALEARRTHVVLEHMRSENEHRFDDTIATFGHPRYELIATGEVYDGADEVREYYRSSRERVPDQSNELIAMYHADHGVGIEMWLRGTPRRDGVDADPFEVRVAAFFDFDGDRIVCERVYWDRRSLAAQVLGRGSATQPTGD